MRRTVRAIVAAVAVVVALAVPSVAAADDPVWERIECLSGAIDSMDTPGDSRVALAGNLDCAASGKAKFGFARYDRRTFYGRVFEPYMQQYAETAPTAFSARRTVEAGPVDFAMCVVTDYRVRIACVRVIRQDSESKLRVEAMTTDDPMVNRTVRVIGWNSKERPACGHCW